MILSTKGIIIISNKCGNSILQKSSCGDVGMFLLKDVLRALWYLKKYQVSNLCWLHAEQMPYPL